MCRKMPELKIEMGHVASAKLAATCQRRNNKDTSTHDDATLLHP